MLLNKSIPPPHTHKSQRTDILIGHNRLFGLIRTMRKRWRKRRRGIRRKRVGIDAVLTVDLRSY
jgi:hypothetical protein